MSKKDKKAKKEAKAAVKKAKKDKQKKAKAAELAEELRAEREAVLDVEEPLAEDAVAVVAEQKQAVKEPLPSTAYAPVEGEKLKAVSIKMPASLVDAADKAAAVYGDTGVSRSEFIRLAIEKLVNETL